MPVTDRERFLFDVHGFLVLPAAVEADFVARCNQAIDAHADEVVDAGPGSFTPALAGSMRRRFLSGMLEWDKPHCEPFREFMVPRPVVPYLNDFLGQGWRMDQAPFAFLADAGSEGLQFHGPGRTEIGEGFYHDYAADRLRTGMLTVEIVLSDHGPGDGGFACIPGSHKAHVRCPQEILDGERDQELLVQPVLRAGDVLVFNEALIHGTLPWRAPHQRRVVLYRFSPKFMTLGGGLAEYRLPAWADDLTAEQRAVLAPPSILEPPLLTDEGVLQEVRASEYAR